MLRTTGTSEPARVAQSATVEIIRLRNPRASRSWPVSALGNAPKPVARLMPDRGSASQPSASGCQQHGAASSKQRLRNTEWELLKRASAALGFADETAEGALLKHVERIPTLRRDKTVLSRAMSQHAAPRIFLVPYVDLANHRAGSGGQYTVADDQARLVTSAAVAEGAEVTLDYGGRPSDELLLQYGFVPARNDEDGVTLRGEDGAVECVVTWEDVRARRVGAAARERCAALLDMMPTSLAEDVDSLRDLEGRVTPAAAAEEEEEQSAEEGGGSLEAALRYRILKKQLLAAAAGQPASSPGSSAFAVRKQ